VATVPGGASNSPQPTNKELPDVEVLLDMEVAGSAAPGANIVMYFGKNGTTKQTLLAVQAAVHDQAANPTVLSLSWGGEEYDTSLGGGKQGVAEKQYQDNMNDLFQTAGTLGITVCVSSGDDAVREIASADSQDPYRLILMDWHMPGMDGIACLDRIMVERLTPEHPKKITPISQPRVCQSSKVRQAWSGGIGLPV